MPAKKHSGIDFSLCVNDCEFNQFGKCRHEKRIYETERGIGFPKCNFFQNSVFACGLYRKSIAEDCREPQN